MLVVSLAVGLCLAEGLARVFEPPQIAALKLNRRIQSELGRFFHYDKNLGWDGIPDAAGEVERLDCTFRVRHNHYGYRGSAHPYSRTEKPRVLILGDSMSWGFGVNDEEIFSRVLEEDSADSIEVVDLGVSGYGTDQELLLWREKGWRWKPDRVFLFFTIGNDLFDNSSGNRYGYAKPVFEYDSANHLQLTNVPVPDIKAKFEDVFVSSGGKEGLLTALSQSALARLVLFTLSHSEWVYQAALSQGVVIGSPPGERMEAYLFDDSLEPGMPAAWRKSIELLRLLQADIKRQGAELVVVLVPCSEQVYPEKWARFEQAFHSPASSPWQPDAPNIRVRKALEQLGIPVVDLLPAFQEKAATQADLYFPHNNHWTKSGHRLAATALKQAGFTKRIKT